MSLLEVKSVSKIYGKGNNAVHALKDIKFSVDKGEYIAIVGESGSGKSTLLNIIGDRKYLEELLNILGLQERKNHLPSELSGGQQQRVAIGRALITRPSLILADEPTGNLDSKNSSEVISLLKESSQKYEQTIIMITHSRSIAQAADRVLRVSDGILVDQGSATNEKLS